MTYQINREVQLASADVDQPDCDWSDDALIEIQKDIEKTKGETKDIEMWSTKLKLTGLSWCCCNMVDRHCSQVKIDNND